MALLQVLGLVLFTAPVLSQSVSYSAASTDCTDANSKTASWEIRNFTFNSDTKLNYGVGNAKKVTFTVKNSANGYSFQCLQGNENHGRAPNHWLEGGKLWYGCSAYCNGAQGLTLEPQPALDTKFSFDPATKVLSFGQTWTCGSGTQSQVQIAPKVTGRPMADTGLVTTIPPKAARSSPVLAADRFPMAVRTRSRVRLST